MANKLTPKQLYEIAKDKYFKVYDFDKDTKAADKKWIRVGLIPDPNKQIRWNFFDGTRLLCEDSFEIAEDFKDGISIVVKDRKYNALRDDGTMVFNEWYNYVYRINGGYMVEKSEDQYSLDRDTAFADANGNIVSEWFSMVIPMLHDNADNLFCVSRKTGKAVYEREQAIYDFSKNEIISDWYDNLGIFTGKVKYARINKGESYNLIGKDGKPIFSIWSKRPLTVDDNGMTQIFSDDGTGYNANIVTGELTKI